MAETLKDSVNKAKVARESVELKSPKAINPADLQNGPYGEHRTWTDYQGENKVETVDVMFSPYTGEVLPYGQGEGQYDQRFLYSESEKKMLDTQATDYKSPIKAGVIGSWRILKSTAVDVKTGKVVDTKDLVEVPDGSPAALKVEASPAPAQVEAPAAVEESQDSPPLDHVVTVAEFLNSMELYKARSEPSSDKSQQVKDLRAAGRGLQAIKRNLGKLFDGNKSNDLGAQNGILEALENNQDNPAYQDSILMPFVEKALAKSEGGTFTKPDNYPKIAMEHKAGLPMRFMEIRKPPEGGVQFDKFPEKSEKLKKVEPARESFEKAGAPVDPVNATVNSLSEEPAALLSVEARAKFGPPDAAHATANVIRGRLEQVLHRIKHIHSGREKRMDHTDVKLIAADWRSKGYEKHADVLDDANNDENRSHTANVTDLNQVLRIAKNAATKAGTGQEQEGALPTPGSKEYSERLGEMYPEAVQGQKEKMFQERKENAIKEYKEHNPGKDPESDPEFQKQLEQHEQELGGYLDYAVDEAQRQLDEATTGVKTEPLAPPGLK